uniref:Lysosomal enzyme trafficking factor n=2 Tax=Sander lucioperca TaxID=283035 RepID=A0A8C9YZ68_SANLU
HRQYMVKPSLQQSCSLKDSARRKVRADRNTIWRMMNFRQRLGWLSVAFFLLLSVGGAYYVFEVRSVSLEHVQRGVSGPSAPPPPSWAQSLAARLPPLPVWMWASVFLLPYLQLFLFLFSCTRADPRAIGYCVLPVCLALLCSRCAARKPANHRAPSLIHT